MGKFVCLILLLFYTKESVAPITEAGPTPPPAFNTTTAPWNQSTTPPPAFITSTDTWNQKCPEIHQNVSSDIGFPGYQSVMINMSTCPFWKQAGPSPALTGDLKEYFNASHEDTGINLTIYDQRFTSNTSDIISGNVVANYSNGTALIIPLRLTIVEINEPPVFMSPAVSTLISETAPVGTSIFTVTVADPDSEVSELSTTSNLVSIERNASESGEPGHYLFTLRLKKPLDVDTPNEAFLPIPGNEKRQFMEKGIVVAIIPLTATDRHQLSTNQRFFMEIQDENDNPPVCSPAQKIVYVPRHRTEKIEVLSLNSVCTDKDFAPVNTMMSFSFDESKSTCTRYWTDYASLRVGAALEVTTDYASLRYGTELEIISDYTPLRDGTTLEVTPFFLEMIAPCDINIVAIDPIYQNTSSSITLQLRYKECPADTDMMGTRWFQGRIGFIETLSCPFKTQYGWITRYCDQDGVYRDPVYNCTRSLIMDIYYNVMYARIFNTTEVLKKLVNVTRPEDSEEQLMVGDVESVRSILKKITHDLSQSDTLPDQDTDSFLDVVNTLIGEKAVSTWKVLVNQTSIGAESIFNYVDTFVYNMAKQSNSTFVNRHFTKSNLYVAISETSSCSVLNFPRDTLHDSNDSWARGRSDNIRVPCKKDQVYSGSFYRNLSRVIALNSAKDMQWVKTVNAPVISFAYLSNQTIDTTAEISFQIYDTTLSDPVCAYLQFNESSGPHVWSTEGCWLTSFDRDTGIVTCMCNHFTNFAVLMSPAVMDTDEAKIHSYALGIFSIIGCSISMVGLALTFVVYLGFWRALSSDRTVLLMNICPIFFIGYLVFLAGIEKTSNPTVCTAIAVVLHYTFLVVFFLMLAEGLMIAYMVLSPFRKRRVVVPLIIAAYVVPVFIVGISMGATQLQGYGNESFCWLTVDSGLFWAFAGPIILIVVANSVNLVIILKFGICGITAMAKKSDLEKFKTGARSVGVLTPMFGITWLIGSFAVNDATLVFQWLFVILNSLQGLMIFIVKCPLDKKVQDAFNEKRRRFQSGSNSTSEGKNRQKPVEDSKPTDSSML